MGRKVKDMMKIKDTIDAKSIKQDESNRYVPFWA